MADPNPRSLQHLQPDQNVFEHLPIHRVVVCRLCRYAVPPKAVDRHLKDIHRLARSARQPLVTWVDALDLAEPEDVLAPTERDGFPVAGLPVHSGLRCNFVGCGHLCLTQKRMRSHWLSVHPTQSADLDCSAVQVQTFFRGNLLKYFSASVAGDVHSERGPLHLSNYATNARARDWRPMGSLPPEASFASDTLRCPSPIAATHYLPPDPEIASLVQHYQQSTYRTIATQRDGDDFLLWKHTVLELGHRQPFLMLALFSVTALHMAHLLPTRRKELTIQANAYQDQAMPVFRDAIARPDSENCHAILIFSHLLVINIFTSEQQDDNLLLVTSSTDDTVPLWLYVMRNSCTILCSLWNVVEEGPCYNLALAWDAPFQVIEAREKSFTDSLAAIATIDAPWSDAVRETYHEAATELALAVECSESNPDVFTTWDALRIWPMRISESFVGLLKDEHPAALILLAHYTILLRRIESQWYFQDQAKRLLGAVKRKLDPRWHVFIPTDDEGVI